MNKAYTTNKCSFCGRMFRVYFDKGTEDMAKEWDICSECAKERFVLTNPDKGGKG